jgi:arsenate reductase
MYYGVILMKMKVLFICVHNSARSQMAEAYLKLLGGDQFEAESAGFEPTVINPLVVQAMKEEGIDLSAKKTQDVYDLLKQSRFFGYVVTVCERARETQCPTFPGVAKKLHWDLENPEDFTGTDEDKLAQIRLLRDKIKNLVKQFIEDENKFS